MALYTNLMDEEAAAVGGRERWASPAQLLPIPVGLLFVAGRHFGMVAHVPVWLLIGSLAFGWFASTVSGLLFPNRATLNLGVEIAVITLVTYVIGWGALLAVGFVFCVAPHIDEDGSPRVVLRSCSRCSESLSGSVRSRSGS